VLRGAAEGQKQAADVGVAPAHAGFAIAPATTVLALGAGPGSTPIERNLGGGRGLARR
jgi:hypothetical protein